MAIIGSASSWELLRVMGSLSYPLVSALSDSCDENRKMVVYLQSGPSIEVQYCSMVFRGNFAKWNGGPVGVVSGGQV